MRLFVAVTPPPVVAADLEHFLESRRDAGGELRWADPEQWHVTLAFLPTVSPHSVDRLTEGVSAAVAGRSPFALRVEGGGAFPNPARARVLVAGIVDPSQRLPPLARAVRAAANHAGAPVEGKRFHPHLTLARWRIPAEATRWVRVLDTYAGAGWVVEQVRLVESHLGEGRGRRPRHETVATFPLIG